jgi:hypothetical protein
VACRLVGKLAVAAGGTTGIDLASANFDSMSDCQDGLSNMVEQLQPEWHEVFVREGTIVRSPISIHCSKLDSKRGAGTRAAERR